MPEVITEFIIFLVKLVVMTFVFYFAGLIVVGKKRALLIDAFVIALLGSVISYVFIELVPTLVVAGPLVRLMIGVLGTVVALIGILFVIKYYYETGWLGAFVVAILTSIIYLLFRLALELLLILPRLLLP